MLNEFLAESDTKMGEKRLNKPDGLPKRPDIVAHKTDMSVLSGQEKAKNRD
jgi:hypothetical protein